jgi:glucokinase
VRRAGIDVGGTKMLGAVIDEKGKFLRVIRIPTPLGPEPIIDAMLTLARELGPWDSLGVGLPGLVTREGVLRAAPNLECTDDLAVGPLLSKALGARVYVENDATCAMLAEWRSGAARGHDEALLVTLGTGIGGGLVTSGRLSRGEHGFAGEVGHLIVEPDGRDCDCGRRGCWEQYAAGRAFGALAREAAADGLALKAVIAAAGSVDEVEGEHVVEAARAGDGDALTVTDRYARWVAIGLTTLTNVLDPGVIVIGGGVAGAGDVVLDPITTWLHRLLWAPDVRTPPRVVIASLSEEAGVIGAALLADEHR